MNNNSFHKQQKIKSSSFIAHNGSNKKFHVLAVHFMLRKLLDGECYVLNYSVNEFGQSESMRRIFGLIDVPQTFLRFTQRIGPYILIKSMHEHIASEILPCCYRCCNCRQRAFSYRVFCCCCCWFCSFFFFPFVEHWVSLFFTKYPNISEPNFYRCCCRGFRSYCARVCVCIYIFCVLNFRREKKNSICIQ